MPWSDGLTGKSLDIAKSQAPRLRVMAGPGTGKTFAMKRRIIRLIEDEAVSSKEILAVTFTRTSANDLKKELKDLGIPGAEQIQAMTLHAFCFGLLNQKEVFESLGRHPRPLKTFNSNGSPQFELSPLLCDLDLEGTFGDKRSKAKRIRAFEAGWARKQNENIWAPTNEDRAFKTALEKWLKSHGSMLIGELVPLALSYLEENPASTVFDQYKHIVVDEYQDLNKAEQLLIDTLGKKSHLSIVGDVDQSIYSFRYAHPDGITDFKNRHIALEDHSLDECRRCGKNIVEIADSLILNNHSGFTSPRLKSLPEKDLGKSAVIQWSSSDEESNGIANFVNHLISSGQYNPGDILILSPRRILGYKIRDLLQNQDIAVHSFFHEEALEEDLAQKAVTLLKLLAHPDDAVALRYWLGFGSNDWRSNQYKVLRSKANDLGKTPKTVLEEVCSGTLDIKGISHLCGAYNNFKDQLNILNGKSTLDTINFIFPEQQTETKIIREAALLLLQKNETADIAELCDHIETLVTQPEMPESGNFVSIMSLHKSKGLTSKVTIITSCIQGLIPNVDEQLSVEEADTKLQEQRRLFYVAITRAKEVLVISSFIKIPQKIAYKIGARLNHSGDAQASQFMTELGPKKPKPIIGSDWVSANFTFS